MRERQSKKQSIIESVTNTLFGTIFNFLVSLVVYPLVGIDVTMKDIGVLTIIFTFISVIKNFLVRRFFETETWNNFRKKRKS
jgi:uncharacterized membrane protein